MNDVIGDKIMLKLNEILYSEGYIDKLRYNYARTVLLNSLTSSDGYDIISMDKINTGGLTNGFTERQKAD